MKHELVYLEWCDAMVNNEAWLTFDEAIEWGKTDDWVVSQVGWILEENDKYIILTSKGSKQRESIEKMFGSVFKIPTTWILKRETISRK